MNTDKTTPSAGVINDGGPAFPSVQTRSSKAFGAPPVIESVGGMTLRDYFAVKAMQGAMSANMLPTSAAGCARLAYEVADAMLAARQTKGTP